jgi:AraC-like DNA-binding protein
MIILQRMVREIGRNSHESFEIVKHCRSQIFCQQFEQNHHSVQMADHFGLHCEHLFTLFRTFYTIVLQFLQSLHFGPKPFTMDFHSAHVFSM